MKRQLELGRRLPKPITVFVLASAKHYCVIVDVNNISDKKVLKIAGAVADIFHTLAAQYKEEISARGKRNIFPRVPTEDVGVNCTFLTFSSPATKKKKKTTSGARQEYFSGEFCFLAEPGVKVEEFFTSDDA